MLYEQRKFKGNNLVNITEFKIEVKEKDLDFNEIDKRFAAVWNVHSSQRKRY